VRFPSARDEVVALDADESTLHVATGDAVLALDHGQLASLQQLTEWRHESGSVRSVASSSDGAFALIRDPAGRGLRVVGPRAKPDGLLGSSELIAPLASPLLGRAGSALWLAGLDPSGGRLAWWEGTAVSESPARLDLPEGWSAATASPQGLVLVSGSTVRILELSVPGWRESASIDVVAPVLSAATAGEHLVVLLSGEIVVYSVADPLAIAIHSRHPGSAYRAVTPLADGEVLLWSPRFAVAPLRWNPEAALPAAGDGFETVYEGLP
jgi:hypothetical protein